MAFGDIRDPNLRRVIISSLIGATIEWYDSFLYGAVASRKSLARRGARPSIFGVFAALP